MDNNMIMNELDYQTFIKIISNISSCIFFKDTRLRYRFSTHYWEQLSGQNIVGKTDMEIRLDKENAVLAMENDRNIIRTGKGCSYMIKSDVNGSIKYLEIIKEPVMNEDGKVIGIVGLINDITERTLLQERISELVNIDELTSVLNRRCGTNAINLSLECSKKNKAFCILDINRFKEINDTYGHQVGDVVLKTFGNTLKSSVYADDIVMRLGGDEFIIFLNNVEETTQIKSFIDKLFENINCMCIPELKHPISVSIGVKFVNNNSTFDSLYTSADKAMYEAKQNYKKYVIRR